MRIIYRVDAINSDTVRIIDETPAGSYTTVQSVRASLAHDEFVKRKMVMLKAAIERRREPLV